MNFTEVLKFNPNHDAHGEFASSDVDASSWKKVGPQAGSNPGGVYEDEQGTRHYIKFPQGDLGQIHVEKLADSIYTELGIHTKETKFVHRDGREGIAGKMLAGSTPMTKEAINAHPDVKAGRVADAYLANYDVFGLTHDNILLGKEGHAHRIDNGGALDYRAQGERKNYTPDKVDELSSMVAPGKKGNLAYGDLPASEVKRQADHLVKTMTDGKINQLVKASGFTGPNYNKYVTALKGRRDFIASHFAKKSELVFIDVLKFNPNHDASGKFTTDSHIGPAQSIVRKDRVKRDANEVLQSALPNPQERQEFASKNEAMSKVYAEGQTSKAQNLVPGTKRYTPERLVTHRAIIKHMIGDASRFKPTEGEAPKALLLGGRGGSGKSNFEIETNPSTGIYSRKNTLILNSDRIKELLPGYTPETVAMYHDESKDILSKAVVQAKRQHLNTVLDLTMAHSAKKWVDSFHKAGYKVEGAYVHRPADMAQESAIGRWNKPNSWTDLEGKSQFSSRGRLVPLNVISESNNEKNFDHIVPSLDKWSVFNNSEKHFSFKKVAEGAKATKEDGEEELEDEEEPEDFDKIAIDCKFLNILKFDPNHDPKTGEFSSGPGTNGPPVDNFLPTADAVKSVMKLKKNPDKDHYIAMVNKKPIGTIQKTYPGASHWEVNHPELGKTQSYNYSLDNAKYVLAKMHSYHIQGQLKKSKIPLGTMTEETLAGLHAKVKEAVPAQFTKVKGSSTDAEGVKTINYAHTFYTPEKAEESFPTVSGIYAGSGAQTTLESPKISVEAKIVKPQEGPPSSLVDLHKALYPTIKEKKILTEAQVAKKALLAEKNMPKKLEKAKEEYGAKHHDLTLSSMNLQQQGKYSAAKSKLQQLQKAESKLTQYGMSAPEVSAFVGEHSKKFTDFINGEKDKVQALMDTTMFKKAELGAAGKMTEWYSLPEKIAAQTEYDANPGIHKAGPSNFYMEKAAAKVKASKYATLTDLSAHYHSSQGLEDNNPTALLEKAAGISGKAKSLGATDFEIEAAKNNNLGIPTPSTSKEGALANVLLSKIQAVKHNYSIGAEWSPESKVKNKTNAFLADAQVVANEKEYLKQGGSPEELKKFNTEKYNDINKLGMEAYNQEKYADQYAHQLHSEAISEAWKNYSVAQKTKGEDHPDTKAALEVVNEAGKKATEDPKYPLSMNGLSNAKNVGQNQGEAVFQGMKTAAMAETKSAVYNAEYAKDTYGDNHPDTQAAILNQEQVVSKNQPFLHASALSYYQQEATAAIANKKLLMEKVKSLGPLVEQRIKEYDSGTFEPTKESTRANDITHLNPTERNTVENYTSSGYRPINKASAVYDAGDLTATGYPNKGMRETIAALDKATQSSFIDENMVLKRNFPSKYFFKAFGVDQSDPNLNNVTGGLYRETAFSSTSMEKNWQSSFANATDEGKIAMEIRIQKGMPGLRYGGSEGEVILPRGQTYLIRSIHQTSGNRYTVKADAILNDGGRAITDAPSYQKPLQTTGSLDEQVSTLDKIYGGAHEPF